MRTAIPPKAQSVAARFAHSLQAGEPASRKPLCRSLFRALAFSTVAIAMFGTPVHISAQEPAAQTAVPAATPAHKPIPNRMHRSPTHPTVAQTPDPPVPVTPPEPEKPKWPAYDHPAQASVIWDSRGLSIDASNSSLQQIMTDVSTATGVKVEGMGSDQRIFGTYGPGQARDVLAQLLQGSGYNVLMIGDQGQGTPRRVLLSTRQSGGAQPAARNSQPNNDEENEVEEQPVVPAPVPEAPVRQAFPPGAPPRSPQQIMQDMQQRQQQLREQQQNQPQQPQN
jgi:hypothetical protein